MRKNFGTTRLILALCLAALLAGGLPTAPAAANNPNWIFEKIVQKGMDGFSAYASFSVNAQGNVAFWGVKDGLAGIFLYNAGLVSRLIAVGDPLPASPGIFPATQTTVTIDDLDRVWFMMADGNNTDNKVARFVWLDGVITYFPYSITPYPDNLPSFESKYASGRLMSKVTPTGWLLEGITTRDTNLGITHDEFFLTNGKTSTKVFDFTYGALCGGAAIEAISEFTSDSILVHHGVHNTPCGGGIEDFSWRLEWRGRRSGIVASGATPTQLWIGIFINEVGDVVYSTSSLKPQLCTFTYISSQGTGSTGCNIYGNIRLTSQGMAASRDLGTDGNLRWAVLLLKNPGLQEEIIVQAGDTLFGQQVTSALVEAASQPGHIVFTFFLADNSRGIGLAKHSSPRWINPAGGDYGSGANWETGSVPGASDNLLFDLPNSYDVTVGSRTAKKASLKHGSLVFRQPDLTLSEALWLGNDAQLTLPEGVTRAAETVVGALLPGNIAQPSLARLHVHNSGTQLITNGSLKVGEVSNGELFISNGAMMSSLESRVGSRSPGTTIVGGEGACWQTGNLAVGYQHDGVLNIEAGGKVTSAVNAYAGWGEGLSEAETANHSGQVLVTGGTPGGVPSRWDISQTLWIGSFMPGIVTVTDGGEINANEVVINHESDLAVRGVNASGRPSKLNVTGDLVVSFIPNNARASMNTFLVNDGAQVHVSGNLELGASPSILDVTWVGFSGAAPAFGLRSTVEVHNSADTASCLVGNGSSVDLGIVAGALLACDQVVLGAQPNSGWTVLVSGSSPLGPSEIHVRNSLLVGSASAGTLDLQNGRVTVQLGVLVSAGSKITGSGMISPGSLGLTNEGVIDPGINITPPGGQNMALSTNSISMPSAPQAYFAIPGTLTVSGNLTFGPGGALQIDLTGLGQYDRLVVEGAAALNGQLALNFSQGYAPKQGDVFNFITASGGATSAFSGVTVNGLAPGFQYQIDSNTQGFTLIALNDGIPTTEPSFKLFVPMVAR